MTLKQKILSVVVTSLRQKTFSANMTSSKQKALSINMKKLSKFLLALFVLLIIGGVIKPYLRAGFPYTHDGEAHLTRFANYKVALKEGQLPPRFAPNLMNHYGYPVFNYNYPLANILSTPFSALKIPYQLTFKILAISFILSSLAGSYFWLKSLDYKQTNHKKLLLVASMILLTPFVVNLTHYRGGIGELSVLALFPWLLWEIKLLAKNNKSWWLPILFVFNLTLLFLAHNISALFGGISLGLYALYESGFSLKLNDLKKFITKFRIGLISILLSLWFWLPAMAEKSLTIIDRASLSLQYKDHFLTLSQLISAPFSFGYSYSVNIDSMNLSLGLIAAVAILISSLLILKNKSFRKRNVFFILLSIFLIFLQTEQSSFIWQSLPFVGFIQFPWRLQLFGIFFALPLILGVMNIKLIKKLILVLVIFQIINIYQAKPADYFNKTNLDYDLSTSSSSVLNENLPKDFTYDNVADWKPIPSAIGGEATFNVSHWDGSSRNYQVSVVEKTTVVEPTINFAGWETTINGQQTNYINTDEIKGRLAYELEPGEYQVATKFTQNTWPRKTGNIISGISWLGFLTWIVIGFKKHAKTKSR